MPQLVALDLPGGPEFVEQLQRIWDAGDAAFPVDQRLPSAAKRALIEEMGCGRQPVDPGDAVVVATSGSSGAPKGVVLTHESLAASAEATSRRLGVTEDDHWLACLPLSHVGGLSVVTRALHMATRLTLLPGFDADLVDASDASLVSLVATALQRIDASRFRKIVLGGSRPPADRPANVVITYGMTETGSGVVYDRTPLDGVDVRIVDGEIQVRGPMLLRCYRSGVDPKSSDGWLPTGDLGDMDESGMLDVHGRRDELIITGGENVWPEQIEAVLRSHERVADVAVGGRADPDWGEVVVAYVVPADRSDPPSLASLRDHVKRQAPAYQAPRHVVYVDDIPRTAVGKVQRVKLSNRLE